MRVVSRVLGAHDKLSCHENVNISFVCPCEISNDKTWSGL